MFSQNVQVFHKLFIEPKILWTNANAVDQYKISWKKECNKNILMEGLNDEIFDIIFQYKMVKWNKLNKFENSNTYVTKM